MTIGTDKVRTRALAVATIAIAGVVLTGCSLLGSLGGGNLGSGNDVGANGATNGADGTTTDVFTIGVGDCLNDGDATGDVSDVTVIDCSSAHDSEAYKSVTLTDGDFLGETATYDQAISDCTSAFPGFVGIDFDKSTLNFSYYYPTEASWAQGDREILCLVVDPAGKTTGSLKGAAR